MTHTPMPPLTWRSTGFYSIGQIAEGTFTATISFFLLFYYNQVLGLSGTMCGLALAIALVCDAISDPLIGTLSDKWPGKLGRRHPFMFAAIVPLPVCFFGLFNPPELEGISLFLWFTFFAVATRSAMTLYHIPHLALAAEMTSDYDKRTSLVSVRQIFGSAGMLMVYAIGFGIFFGASEEYPNGQLNPAAYMPFTLCIALLMAVSIFTTSAGTMNLIEHLPKASTTQRYSLVTVFSDIQIALKNQSFKWLILSFMIILAAAGISSSLALHVKTFFWELTPGQLPILLGVSAIATIVGFALSAKICAIFDKRGALIYGAALWGLVQVSLTSAKLLGFMPESPDVVFAILLVGGVLQGLSGAQVSVASASMLADLVDEHELHTHERHEGIFFGAFAFSNKFAQGAGVIVGGLVLDIIAWPKNSSIRVAADIDPDTVATLAFTFGPLVGLLVVPSILFALKYSMTRDMHSEIRRSLTAQKQPIVAIDLRSQEITPT